MRSVSILTCNHLSEREVVQGGGGSSESQPPHYWLVVSYIKVASQSHSLESSWLAPALCCLMENIWVFIRVTLYFS